MMNVVAVCLVLSSLVTAGVWSPSPPQKDISKKGEDVVIVKEGHRVVVVEYDPDQEGNTKVFISPQDTHLTHGAKIDEGKAKTKAADDIKGKAKEVADEAKEKTKGIVDEAKEKAKDAASVLPNLGQGVTGPTDGRGPRELVCDAFGKCKHKISGAFGKAKEKVLDTAHEVTEKAYEVEDQAKGRVCEGLDKARDTICHEGEVISEKAHEIKEASKDKAKEVSQKAKDSVKEAVDTSKTIGKDVVKNVSSKIDEGKKELGEIFGRGRDLAKDVFNYVFSPKTVESTMGVVHLLGFATSYGMCVWVTFVSSYVLAGALARPQFGLVQSKVYPVYFRVLAYTILMGLIGHLHGQRSKLFSNTVGMAQAYSLMWSFAMVLFNLLYLEPRATKVMFKRMKLEREEGRGRVTLETQSTGKGKVVDHPETPTTTASAQTPSREQEKHEAADFAAMSQITKLGEKLKKLNAYSSFLNILTLMALTWHLVYLGQRLHVAC